LLYVDGVNLMGRCVEELRNEIRTTKIITTTKYSVWIRKVRDRKVNKTDLIAKKTEEELQNYSYKICLYPCNVTKPLIA